MGACGLELYCCQGTTILPLRLLATKRGDRNFADILPQAAVQALQPRACAGHLWAGHREHNNGAPADWAIELVPVSRVSPR